MPIHDTYEILDRENKVLMYIGEGKSAKVISGLLKVSIDTVYDDKKRIQKKALSNFKRLGSKELAYYYEMMLTSIFNISQKAYEIYDNTELDTDKLKALKLCRENITEMRELIKESTNIKTIEDMKTQIEDLINSHNKQEQSSYMQLNLPHMIDIDSSNNNTEVNNNVGDNNNSDTNIGNSNNNNE